MKTTLGGDRLGSGNKQEISMRNYERSTHDLSELFRSSMSSGTLVPFLKKLALPGDNFDIELNCEVMTLPTIGPLFGSYKVQLDIFEVPLRLYNANLHQNRLGVGMDMASMYFPQIRLLANNHTDYSQSHADGEHINSSCLLKYLGISGLGHITGTANPAERDFNAIPLLAYWEIYKNYYSNKQEDKGYFVHSDDSIYTASVTALAASVWDETETIFKGDILDQPTDLVAGDIIIISYPSNAPEIDPHSQLCGNNQYFDEICNNIVWNNSFKTLRGTLLTSSSTQQVVADPAAPLNGGGGFSFGLQDFPLENIDAMRDDILAYTATPNPFLYYQELHYLIVHL